MSLGLKVVRAKTFVFFCVTGISNCHWNQQQSLSIKKSSQIKILAHWDQLQSHCSCVIVKKWLIKNWKSPKMLFQPECIWKISCNMSMITVTCFRKYSPISWKYLIAQIFGGISNRSVLLLLHVFVLSEAMMMYSTVIRCESGTWVLLVYGFLIGHLNHKIRQWDKLCSRITHLVETCCFIIATRNRSQCMLVTLKRGGLFPWVLSIFVRWSCFLQQSLCGQHTSNWESCSLQSSPLPRLPLQLAVAPVWAPADCRSRP